MTLRAIAEHLRQQRNDLHRDLFPRLPRLWMEAAARAVGLEAPDGQITYDHPEQIAACTDLVLYALPEGRALLAQTLAETPSLDFSLRGALLRARYALLEISRAPHPDIESFIEVRDLRSGESGVLADPQLARPELQGAHVATHLLDGPGFWLTTGAPMPIDAELARRARDRRDLEGAALVATVIRSQWSLRPPPATDATPRPHSRPGRQDPCPCGSGKVYRRCHGLRR